MKLSVCIIGKNEEKTLERCLNALKDYPFEIVFTDTGSTDSTREIATRYTDKVFDFAWIDDFSAARNFCTGKASNDWILCIDCDEYLEPLDLTELEQFLSQNENAIGTITIRSLTAEEGSADSHTVNSQVPRLYNRRNFHFVHPVHEQLVSLHDTPANSLTAKVSVLHSGYVSDNSDYILKKRQRNIRLLEKEIENCKDTTLLPYLFFQIGQSYNGYDTNKALSYFEKSLKTAPDTKSSYFPLLVTYYGYLLMEIEDSSLILEKLLPYNAVLSHFADYNYLLAVLYVKTENYITAADFLIKALNCHDYADERTTNILPNYYLGCIYKIYGRWADAINAFQRANHYENSDTQIIDLKKRLKQNYPYTICIIGHGNNKSLHNCIQHSLQITNDIVYLGQSSYSSSIDLVRTYSFDTIIDYATLDDAIESALSTSAKKYLLVINEYELPRLNTTSSDGIVLVQETFQTLLEPISLYHQEYRLFNAQGDASAPHGITVQSQIPLNKEQLLERFEDIDHPFVIPEGAPLSSYADYHYLAAIIYMQHGLFNDAISEFLEATKLPMTYLNGVNDYKAFYHIGLIYELSKMYPEAIVYYEKCGDFEAAKIRKEQLKCT